MLRAPPGWTRVSYSSTISPSATVTHAELRHSVFCGESSCFDVYHSQLGMLRCVRVGGSTTCLLGGLLVVVVVHDCMFSPILLGLSCLDML